MRIHYIQHVPFEGLGYIEQWLTEHKHTVTATRMWMQEKLPALDAFDVLIVLGGPMGVYDDHLLPWLSDEKNFIYAAIREDKKVIGICLGAQLMACVLGATVFTNKYKEIGWYPVKIDCSLGDWLGRQVPEELKVFHWHGDKFDIPYGGVIHAGSAACNHQVFTYGNSIIGLQFHLEATTQTIQAMLEHGAHEITEAPYIQTAEEMVAQQAFEEPNRLMGWILEKMCNQ